MSPGGLLFQRWSKALFAAAGLFVVYLYGLGALGMVGPDEPRYASIGRAMAATGDYVTPRLWGTPWFEKPALLYWLIAAGFRGGLSPEWAPRLGVALLSVVFLIAYWWIVRRGFGSGAAWCAALFLSTCAGWVAFSQVAVTDLPLAAFSALALMLVIDVLPDRAPSVQGLCLMAGLLGAAVLAKGLVPLVLALPALWTLRKHWKRIFHPAPVAVFLAVALPWYVLCWIRNGNEFLNVFFVQHQLGRFASDALQHVQPFWFYVPVLLGGMFPWVLLAPVLFRRSLWDDPRLRYLVLWVVFGFLFFSASRNKLPGYLLPLMPPLMALLGVAVMRMRRAAPLLALTCLLLIVVPVAMFALPEALAHGTAVFPIPEGAAMRAILLLPVAFVLAATVYFMDRGGTGRVLAISLIAGVVCVMVGALKVVTLPAVDPYVTARKLLSAAGTATDVCVGSIPRAWRYGLNYYKGEALPDCGTHAAPIQIEPAVPRPVLTHASK